LSIVAVTGATGLLGGHILQRLCDANVPVIALYRAGQEEALPDGVTKREADILDQPSLIEAFEGATTVVHAAAFVSFNPRRKKKVFVVNVEGTRQVVNTCLQLGIKNLIHVSSVSALGRKSGTRTTEETKWDKSITSAYGESKHLAELEVFRGGEEGLNVSIVNPSIVLSGSKPARSSATLFDYVWNQKPFYTNGAMNYVDARDVAEAIYKLYLQPQPGEKFILSAGSIPFIEFFTAVAKKFNRKAPNISISPATAQLAGWTEEVLAFLLNREPVVTRESARMAVQSFEYENKKAVEMLELQFQTLETTLAWCCAEYLRNVNPKKQNLQLAQP
jgi:dihydroflavonol-4-reductase